MGLDATGRRRWFGAAALLAAGAMLVAGETVLKGRLAPAAFLLYWFLCFGFTGLAIITAFRDARALRDRTKEEQRELLDSALKEILTSKKPQSSGLTPRENLKPQTTNPNQASNSKPPASEKPQTSIFKPQNKQGEVV